MPGMITSNMNLECMIRLLVACLCGAIIGVERTKRNKGAGIRTHVIVAVGAALFVIISKYGFNDIVALAGPQVDVSRIASNVVTGVSFLGAGIIFMKGDSVQGLTTAAGIWMTAAIGMAVGTGMYILGVSGALLILVIQEITHHGVVKVMENMTTSRMVVSMEDDPDAYVQLENLLTEKKIMIKSTHIKRRKDASLTYTLEVRMPRDLMPEDILMLIRESKNVKSIGI